MKNQIFGIIYAIYSILFKSILCLVVEKNMIILKKINLVFLIVKKDPNLL